MGIKAGLSKVFARRVVKKMQTWINHPVEAQQNVFNTLIENGKITAFGKDHHFSEIKNYEDFKKNVPVVDYEVLRSYVERMVEGEENVLWPGKPAYWAKTSGTTSGAKYIPISKESMPTHIAAARNALLNYINETGNTKFVNGKMIFLQGSPTMEKKNGVLLGRLSGIVAHHVPGYLQKNRLPSFETNCIEDWETKVDAIVDETVAENMTLISGIPSWVQMYYEKLQEKSGKEKIKDLFPNFSLFVYGGVNFEPYRQRFENMIGKKVDSIETYPASEGFIAFQDSQTEKGLLLLVDGGIFYEFIPMSEIGKENPNRLSLEEVELDVFFLHFLIY